VSMDWTLTFGGKVFTFFENSWNLSRNLPSPH